MTSVSDGSLPEAVAAPLPPEGVPAPLPAEPDGAPPRPGRLRPLLRGLQLPMWSGVQVSVQMGVALLSARWLGPGDRGDFVLATTIATLLLLVSSLGAGQTSRVLLAERGRWWTWTRYVRFASVLAVPHLVISGTVGLFLLSLLSSGSPDVVLPFLVYSVAALAAHLFREGLHGLGLHRTSMGLDVGNAALQLTLTAAAYRAGVLSVGLALYIGAACYAVTVAVQVLVGRAADVVGRAAPRPDRQEFWRESRGFLRMSRFVLVAALGQAFVVNGDRLVLGAAGSSAQVGIYAAASSLAQVTWVAPIALTPLLTRRTAAAGDLEDWRRAHRPVLLLTAVLAVVVAGAGWFAIPVLLGQQFVPARSVLPILCLAAIPYASYQFDSAACNGLRDVRTGALGALVGSVVLVGCTSGGYALAGTRGLAAGVGLTYVVMAVVVRRRLVANGPRHGRHRRPVRTATRPAGAPGG